MTDQDQPPIPTEDEALTQAEGLDAVTDDTLDADEPDDTLGGADDEEATINSDADDGLTND